jgi:hypothetical protein
MPEAASRYHPNDGTPITGYGRLSTSRPWALAKGEEAELALKHTANHD